MRCKLTITRSTRRRSLGTISQTIILPRIHSPHQASQWCFRYNLRTFSRHLCDNSDSISAPQMKLGRQTAIPWRICHPRPKNNTSYRSWSTFHLVIMGSQKARGSSRIKLTLICLLSSPSNSSRTSNRAEWMWIRLASRTSNQVEFFKLTEHSQVHRERYKTMLPTEMV